MKYYQGRIPACGVYCGGCPVYVREKKACPGAGINTQRCEHCKTFHLCCKERTIANCFQCTIFPCYKFKRFAKSWLKYGQNLIENQHLLNKIGPDEFLKHFHSKINNMFSIRQANVSDIPGMKELYKNTVLTVNRKDYTAGEVEDWASCGDDIDHWDDLLADQHYIVAENDIGEMVGFASINDTGYLHSLFVHKDFQHRGIASLLYQTLEKYAKDKTVERITSEVSITARPFFEKQGFVVDEEQKRKANKMYLTNYKMSKVLTNDKITNVARSEYPELMRVWEASVRATHHFLKEEDILFFKKIIPGKYLDMVRLYAVRNAENAISGFMGVSDVAVEMLFIHPDSRGRGIGSALLDFAVNELHVHKLDVNEQNEQALGFYLHKGFSIAGRSALDGTGKPYPLLHMEIEL